MTVSPGQQHESHLVARTHERHLLTPQSVSLSRSPLAAQAGVASTALAGAPGGYVDQVFPQPVATCAEMDARTLLSVPVTGGPH